MPTAAHRQFAQEWVDRTWQKDFRLGLLVRGPDWGYDMPRRRHARLKGKEKTKTSFKREQEGRTFGDFLNPIWSDLLNRTLSTAQARQQIRDAGYESAVLIAETREELISAIARILDEGCNCWDSGDQFAWIGNGVFAVNFWYDPSHDSSGRK